MTLYFQLFYSKLNYNLVTYTAANSPTNKEPKRNKRKISAKKSEPAKKRKLGSHQVLVTKSGKYVSPWYHILDPEFDIEAYDQEKVNDNITSEPELTTNENKNEEETDVFNSTSDFEDEFDILVAMGEKFD